MIRKQFFMVGKKSPFLG